MKVMDFPTNEFYFALKVMACIQSLQVTHGVHWGLWTEVKNYFLSVQSLKTKIKVFVFLETNGEVLETLVLGLEGLGICLAQG